MLRDTKTLKKGEVLADMSQFSIEAGRQNAQKRYENLVRLKIHSFF